MIMKKIAIIVLVLLSASCQLPVREPVTIKDLLPVGSILHLSQDLEVQAKRDYVYIQDGKTVYFNIVNTVNIYNPHCLFQLRNTSPEVRKIVADDFVVNRVNEYEDYSVQSGHIRPVAAVGPGKSWLSKAAGSQDQGPGPGIIMYATLIDIHSDKQPDVERLICGHWDDFGIVEPLTFAQMKTALGDLVIVEIRTQ